MLNDLIRARAAMGISYPDTGKHAAFMCGVQRVFRRIRLALFGR